EAAGFFGTSTAQFREIWDMVRGRMDQAAGIDPPPEAQPPNAGQLDQVIANTGPSGAFATAIAAMERELAVQDLAGHLNALADAQSKTPTEIARALGFTS